MKIILSDLMKMKDLIYIFLNNYFLFYDVSTPNNHLVKHHTFSLGRLIIFYNQNKTFILIIKFFDNLT